MISQEFLALIMSIAAGMKDESREMKTVKSWKIEDAIVNSLVKPYPLPSLPKSPSPTFTWKSLW